MTHDEKIVEYYGEKLIAKEVKVFEELEGQVGEKIPLVKTVDWKTFGYTKEGE